MPQCKATGMTYRLMNQAKKLVSMCFFDGYDKFFYPEHETKPCTDTNDNLRIALNAKGIEIVRLLKQENKPLWESEFDRYMNLLKEKGRYEVHETRLILTDFLWELSSLLYTQKVRWGEVFDHSDPFEQMKNILHYNGSSRSV